MSESSKSKRAYDNSRRSRQAQATRAAILESAVALFVDPKNEDLSIPAIAAKADVSEPTVYRHFKNRDTLIEAMRDFIVERVDEPDPPETLEELLQVPRKLFPVFERHADIYAARSRWIEREQIDDEGYRKRTHEYVRLLDDVTAHLDPAEREAVNALMRLLISSRCWRTMREDHGIEGDRAGQVTTWAVETLVESLRSGARVLEPGQRRKPS